MSAGSSGAAQRTGNSLVDELLAKESPDRAGDSPVRIIDVHRSSSRRSQRQQADNESRNSAPNAGETRTRQQKQQSGETLSSFESDYDLLVYLGETETEDIVDTERSLDYQDQTWRQSICGASLAPTIDESLSELVSQSAQPWDLDQLGPPPVRSVSKLANRSPQLRASPRPLQQQQQQPQPQTVDSDECDNEVSLVFEPKEALSSQLSKSAGSSQNPASSKSSKLGDRLASLFNRRPLGEQQQQRLESALNKSRTLAVPEGRSRQSTEMALSANDAAELDRLLAEMSQSLDLDSLARYDPHAGSRPAPRARMSGQGPPAMSSQTLHKFSAAERQVVRSNPGSVKPTENALTRTPERRPFTSMGKITQTAEPAATEASCESILDEYDGASRMLEQMISNQLHVRASPITRIPEQTSGRVPERQPRLERSSEASDSRNSPSKLSSTSSGLQTAQTVGSKSESKASVIRREPGSAEVPTRKASTDCSSLATENSVVLAPSASIWSQKKRPTAAPASPVPRSVPKSPSGSSATSESRPPPSPPAVDYGDDQEVIRVEAAEIPADESLEEPHETQMGRMKRRTLSSMRSMRSKLTDLMAGKPSAQQVGQPRSQPAPPKRSSSIGSRGSAGAEPPSVRHEATRPSRATERRSRTKRRAPEPPQVTDSHQARQQPQSFGQQIRERLSRSKSRFSRFLRPAMKRAQSQPNTRREFVEASELTAPERSAPLFEPGDIARNSELGKAPESHGPSSFDESLDRHIAAKLGGQRAPSGASSGSSQLSGLDTRPSRDRRRRRSAGSSKSANKEPRSTSLLSIKRLSSLRHKQEAPAAAHEDLDSMRVSARDTPSRRRRTEKSSDSEPSPVATGRPPTTSDYFGQVAPARVDSSDRETKEPSLGLHLHPAPINRSARSLNLEPKVEGDHQLERPQRPNRSLSMRSIRAEEPAVGSPDSSSRRLPVPSNTFRPVSACATLTAQAAPEIPERPSAVAVKPVRPGNSPLPGYPPVIESARPAQFEKGRSASGNTSPLRSLGDRCRELFARPPSPATKALVPYPPPVRPPRKRSKSVTADSPEAATIQPAGHQVIELDAVSPASTLDRDAAPSGPTGGGRLAALAQQLKHQAVDFFQGHHQQAPSKSQRSPRHLDLEEPEELVQWRPVIARAGGRGPEGRLTKEGCDEDSGARRAVSLPRPMQQQQQSLDTDSTWESSDDEDEVVRPRTTCDDSPAAVVSGLQAGQSTLAKLANEKGSLPAASEGLCALSKPHDDAVGISIELNNNNSNIDDQEELLKSKQQQVEPAVSSKFATDEPDRLQTNNKKRASSSRRSDDIITDRAQQQVDVDSPSISGAVFGPDLHSEQAEICRTTFEFNANLPSPAQLIKLHDKPAREAAAADEREALVESLVRGDSNLAALLNFKTQEKPSAAASSGEMAVIKGPATGRLDEADVAHLKAIAHPKAKSESQDKQQVLTPDSAANDTNADDSMEDSKRHSVYENVEEEVAAPVRRPRERQWRRPPQPPKPAHLSSLVKARTGEGPDAVTKGGLEPQTGGSEWAVDDDVAVPSPRRSPEPQRAEPREPVRPKPKLIAMTSIVQDPEDELMIGASSQPAQSAGASAPARPQRRDSTFSESLDFENNSDNSTDSSLAAATASRQRLVSKFEARAQSQEPRAARPKFPAFTEGRGAAASGNSLVRRLARNFDQSAANNQPQSSVQRSRPPLAAKPAGLTHPSTSVDEDPRSETSWYDAKGGEQLDEAEVAEFLRELDGSAGGSGPGASGEKPLTMRELSGSISEIGSVSTGADPFVTVADSTLEEGAPNAPPGAGDNDDEDEDDDTLNDDEQLGEEEEEIGISASYVVCAAGEDDGRDKDLSQRQQAPLVAAAAGALPASARQPTGDGRAGEKQSVVGEPEHAETAQQRSIRQTQMVQATPAHCHIESPADVDDGAQAAKTTPEDASPQRTRTDPQQVVEEDEEEESENQDDCIAAEASGASTSQRICRQLGMSERDDQVSLSSSSVSDETDYSEDFSESLPELRQRQNLQRLYHVVNEIYSSEAKFVDTLHLLNIDLRRHLEAGNAPSECVDGLLRHLPQLQALNESLLGELKVARDLWPEQQKIAHVLVKIGPFLKHYSTYIREFESIQQQLQENMKKHPTSFGELVRRFEASERAQRLSIQHHLLKPIQRIPQYRLLLQQYLQHLKPDDLDYEDTVLALEVVSRVAEHANQAMREGANFAKLLALQAKIVGKQRDIVQPGRLFVKEGELMKVCRKQVQPRWFVLLNDALLYLSAIQSSDILYLKNELPLDDCLVSSSEAGRPETEFSVCTRTRSFALIARSARERDDWLAAFRKTIDEHQARRRSFHVRQQLARSPQPPDGSTALERANQSTSCLPEAGGQLLGHRAPIWMPDSRATSCQLCTSGFSALFRRHHCRACGRVVCSACSANKAPLVYLKCRAARVCDQCFEQLKASLHLYYLPRGSGQPAPLKDDEMRRLDEHFLTLLKSQFVRHANLRKLHRLGRNTSGGKSGKQLADRSKEQEANQHKRHVLCEVGAALVQLASSSSSSSLSAKEKDKERKKLAKLVGK